MKSRRYVLPLALALLLDGMAAHSLFAQNEPVGSHVRSNRSSL